jgi:hypothetical protein
VEKTAAASESSTPASFIDVLYKPALARVIIVQVKAAGVAVPKVKDRF